MTNRSHPTEAEVMKELAPGMVNKLLEQAQPALKRRIQALLPCAKPSQMNDFVAAVGVVASAGGMRNATSLEPLTSLLDKYVQKNNLPGTERERLLGELCSEYRKVLTLLYSGMDIFFPGWTQQQLDAGWEATPVHNTEVVKNAAGEVTGVTVETINPPAH